MKKYFYLFVFVFFVCGVNVVLATTDNITQINFISSPQSIDPDAVSAVLTIETQNSAGALEALDTSGTILQLSSTSSTGEFSSSVANWIPVSNLGMNNTWSHRNFYYKDITPGTYTLTVTAQGKSWIPATQTITVNSPIVIGDTTPPTLHLPADITTDAIGPDGVIVNYVVTADDTDPANPIVNCIPSSGTLFPVGETIVNCSAADTAGNVATGNFNVTVKDISVPIILPVKHRTSGSYPIILPKVLSTPSIDVIKKIFDSEKEQVLGAGKYNFSQDLSLGSRGQEVKELQKFLIGKEFLKQGAFGGYFGIFTETALKEYQKANGLWVDGIVGPQTRAVMNK